jgi:predicted nucleotidyltransferase
MFDSMTTTQRFTTFTDLTMERRQRAIEIAQYITDYGRDVLAVELFGSLARGNVKESSDFDFIVTIEGFEAACWMRRVANQMTEPHDRSLKEIRRRSAITQLGLDVWDPHNLVNHSQVDIFIFPPKWQERSWELSTFWKGWDEPLTDNMKHDAIMFVPGQGFPLPLVQREGRRVEAWEAAPYGGY